MSHIPGQKLPLRGWLLLFVLQYSLGFVANAFYGGRSTYRAWRLIHAHTSLAHDLGWYVAVRAGLEFGIAAVLLAGLVRVWQRSSRTRTYWIVGLPVILLLVAIVMACRYAEGLFLVAAGRHSSFMVLVNVTALTSTAVVTLAWLLYWRRSQRVRTTFGPSVADAAA